VRVEVQLFATLGTYLPPDASGDTVTVDVSDGTTVGDLIRALRIPTDLEYLAAVNGVDAAPSHPLADGDVLSLFPPLAGGWG
jgi:molybdopterin converting factor small subunit